MFPLSLKSPPWELPTSPLGDSEGGCTNHELRIPPKYYFESITTIVLSLENTMPPKIKIALHVFNREQASKHNSLQKP